MTDIPQKGGKALVGLGVLLQSCPATVAYFPAHHISEPPLPIEF